MTVWQFLDRCMTRLPGWPTERQWVTIWNLIIILLMLAMGWSDPHLWDVEVFKVILQAMALTGFLNMVLAFHFTAGKSDEAKTENTARALDTIRAVAESGGSLAPATAEVTGTLEVRPAGEDTTG